MRRVPVKRGSSCLAQSLPPVLAAILAGHAVAADLPPGCELRFVPISGPLGLADVALRAPDAEADRATVLLVRRGAEEREAVRLAMRREPIAGSRPAASLFTARLFSGATTGTQSSPAASEFVTFSIELSRAAGRADQPDEARVLGPFTHSASPPPGQSTPDWAKGAVWYQVFPERFRNGNPANDPRGPAHFHKNWTSDWNALEADEVEAARAGVTLHEPHLLRAMPDPTTAAMQARRYGGDLEGLTQKLDDLADLGVTAIYLNPVFEAHSHHKYDATDFRHIDPTLAGSGDTDVPQGKTEDPATWQWTDADRYVLDTLLPAVHSRSMRIVFDGVWNHVGTRFWAFRDLRQRGRASPYADWFQVEFAGDDPDSDARLAGRNAAPGSLIAWKSWNGANGTLPSFSRSTEGRLHPEVEAHIFEVTRRWMQPDSQPGAAPTRGIDGWRLDVAPDLPRPFWKAWTAHAKSINPDSVLMGEFWFDARDYFSGGAAEGAGGNGGGPAVFDGQMNYPVAMPLVRWLADGAYTAAQLGAQLGRVLDRPAQHELVQMNLLGSHDTARVATMIEAGLAEYGGQIPRRVQLARPSDQSYDKVVLGVAMLACWPGAPMVYYGDEHGMHGGNDPHCRKPLPWADAGMMENPADAPVEGLRERFRSWLRLRQDPEIGDVLKYGDVRIIETGREEVFAFERSLNDRRVICIVNRGNENIDASGLLEDVAPRSAGSMRRRGPASAGKTVEIKRRTATLFSCAAE